MVSRVGAWDELLSTCMEGEKSCKEIMMVHTSGGLNVIGLERKEKDWALVLFGPCWPNLGLNSDLNGAQKRGGIRLGLS